MVPQLLTRRRLLLGELVLAAHLLCFSLLAPYASGIGFLVRGLSGWFVSPAVSHFVEDLITLFCVPMALGTTALLETRTGPTSRLDAIVRAGATLVLLVGGATTVLLAYLQLQGSPGFVTGIVAFVLFRAGQVLGLVVVVRQIKEKPTAPPETVQSDSVE